MTSILTNASAASALQTLRAISSTIETAQQRVSTGLRVESAADNAAYWSIATTMRSERAATSATLDSIQLGSAVLETAYSGMEAIQKEYATIRDLLITASSLPEPAIGYPWGAIDVDTIYELDPEYFKSEQAKVSRTIDQHMQQIRSILRSSSFGGVNLLHVGDNSPIKARDSVYSFITGYANGRVITMDLPLIDTLLVNDSFMDDATFLNPDPGDGGILDPSFSLTVLGADGFTHATGLLSFTKWNLSAMGGETAPIERTNDMVRSIEMYVQRHGANRQDAWDYVIPQFDERLQQLIDRTAKLGSVVKAMQGYEDLVEEQLQTIDKGVGRLVDADMDEESTRLKALQTQEQLALQSLQIANANSENVMALFR